ncbi:hypothetical protein Glove_181g15 [Diversispora epigaea]|uniref:Uncharacterized protein n=1 Tax=Diversispora epigaea TaxID=1348612 RepID=A0A397IMT5_9GLOM|nr:hypothetical protein Glove_181g15 [Diversispora epigaea]
MFAIATKFIKQYNLNPQISNSELSQYTLKLLDVLLDNKKKDHAQNKDINLIVLNQTPTGLIDKNIREKSIEILNNRYKFSEKRGNALLQAHSKFINTSQKSEQRENKVIYIFRDNHIINLSAYTKVVITYNGTPQSLEKETIKDMAQRILQDKLNTRDMKAEALAMALLAPNANAVTKISEITEEANKIQKNRRKYVKTFKKINYSDHFTLELIKKRLDKYDISTPSNLQALANIMIMVYIRPAELIFLRITDN